MEPELDPTHKRRETVLTVSLIVIVGGLLLFFLNMISMGIFMYVGIAVLLVGMVGYLHYVMWGQSLTENTAGEREEAEMRARIEGEEWERHD